MFMNPYLIHVLNVCKSLRSTISVPYQSHFLHLPTLERGREGGRERVREREREREGGRERERERDKERERE